MAWQIKNKAIFIFNRLISLTVYCHSLSLPSYMYIDSFSHLAHDKWYFGIRLISMQSNQSILHVHTLIHSIFCFTSLLRSSVRQFINKLLSQNDKALHIQYHLWNRYVFYTFSHYNRVHTGNQTELHRLFVSHVMKKRYTQDCQY